MVECGLVQVPGRAGLVRMKVVLTILLMLFHQMALATPPAWYSLSHGAAGAEVEPYFKGISQTYFVSDVKSEQRAQDEACSDAMRDIAKYFGVNIKVESNISIGSINGSKDIRFSEKTEEIAGLKLFGLKPEKTAIEKIGTSHLRGYCLIVLRPSAKKHIDVEIKKNQLLYDQEINNLQKALIEKDLEVAKIYADTLQALPLVSTDDRLPVLLKQLKIARKGILTAAIKLDKRHYNVGDELKFFVSLNKKANLYVLMDTGSDWQIIYPNISHRLALVKDGVIEFPSERMIKDGVIPVVYKEMFNKKVNVHLVATESNLFLSRHSEALGAFEYLPYGGNWEKEIQNCVVSKKCVEQFLPVKISNPLDNIALTLKGDPKWTRPLRRALKRYGVKVVDKGNCVLNLKVGKKAIHSNRLNMMINQLVITADLNIKHKHNKLLRMNRNAVVGVDEDQLRETSMTALAEKVRNALVIADR